MTLSPSGLPPTTIRARSLTGFSDLATSLGGDPDALLTACGIAPALLRNPENAIPGDRVARLLDRAAAELGAPDLGLQLAKRQDISAVGSLALIVRNSATLADALGAVVANIRYHNPGASLVVEADPTPGFTRLRHDTGLGEKLPRRQSVELAYGILFWFIRFTAKVGTEGWRLAFRHERGMPMRLYRKHFPCAVTFGQPFDALSVPTAILKTPIDRADPDLRAMGERFLKHLQRRYPLDTRRQVQELVGRQLVGGAWSVGKVAGMMGLHPRTLQRRLQAQGVRFQDLVDAVRKDRARELLGYGAIPLAEVALLLGYSGQNAFTLACKRWFGVTPGRFRRDPGGRQGA